MEEASHKLWLWPMTILKAYIIPEGDKKSLTSQCQNYLGEPYVLVFLMCKINVFQTDFHMLHSFFFYLILVIIHKSLELSQRFLSTSSEKESKLYIS